MVFGLLSFCELPLVLFLFVRGFVEVVVSFAETNQFNTFVYRSILLVFMRFGSCLGILLTTGRNNPPYILAI